MATHDDIVKEVDDNYEAFLQMLPAILPQHRNKYALIKNKKVIGFYSTLEDAHTTATTFYPSEPFSIQKVTDIPEDLGFFSHALDIR